MQELMKIIESLEKSLSDKESKRLQINLLKRLIKKNLENNIEDKELLDKIKKLSNDLKLIYEGNTLQRKKYKKDFKLLTESIKRKYGYVPKGTYISMYISIGIAMGAAIGSAIGASFISLNPVYISICISVGSGMGIAFGLAIGYLKEREAETENKLY